MKQNNLWKFLFVVFIICWSFVSMYPPTSRDLVQQFAARADDRDAAFTNILARVDALQKEGTNSEFANLRAAIGTNDIQGYFPFINATNQANPTTYILNRIQRDASGKIKLGLDLQGGTAFLVQMTNAPAAGTTNAILQEEERAGNIAQAVSVLRNRVDEFGVAEPTIQPEGSDEILIQLPGLSEAEKESAEANIQKAAFLEFRMVKDDSGEIVDLHTGQELQPIPPNYEKMKCTEQQSDGKFYTYYYVVKKKAENGLAGNIVKSARMGRGNLGEPEIEFELTPDAAKKFADVTTEYAPEGNLYHSLAIVLDGQLYSAPRINDPILGGNVQIPAVSPRKRPRNSRPSLKIR